MLTRLAPQLSNRVIMLWHCLKYLISTLVSTLLLILQVMHYLCFMLLPVQCFQVVCPSVHVRHHGWSILRSAYYLQCLLLQPLTFSNLFYVKIKFCWKCVKQRCRGWAIYLWWQSARLCQHTDSDVHIHSIQSNTDHSSTYVHTIAGTAVIETHWINCTGSVHSGRQCPVSTGLHLPEHAQTCFIVSRHVRTCPNKPGHVYACPSMPTIVSLCNPDKPGHVRTCPGMTCPGMFGQVYGNATDVSVETCLGGGYMQRYLPAAAAVWASATELV